MMGGAELKEKGLQGNSVSMEEIVPWRDIKSFIGKAPKTGIMINLPWTKILSVYIQVK